MFGGVLLFHPKGSIIGADRLSFRVRNGTGRFPVAVAAVTLLRNTILLVVLVGGVAFGATISRGR